MRNLTLIIIALFIIACNSIEEQTIVEPPGPIDNIIEPEEKTAQVYLDAYPFLGNVLLLGKPNEVVVHLADVIPQELIVEIEDEKVEVNHHGIIQYTPKREGEIYLSVFVMEEGKKVSYGKTKFRVMSAETTLGEINTQENHQNNPQN